MVGVRISRRAISAEWDDHAVYLNFASCSSQSASGLCPRRAWPILVLTFISLTLFENKGRGPTWDPGMAL